jgi:hypothetical protein
MPFIIIRPRRALTIIATLLGAVLLMGAVPSLAAAACQGKPTSEAFAPFGDSAAYSLAPGGSFESGAEGWSLAKAAVVTPNESYNVVPGTHSLAIAPGGVAASPWLCVSSEFPSFRLFVRQLSGSPSESLHVSVRLINLLGLSVNTAVSEVHSDGSWAPSPALALGESVPLWLPGTSANLQLAFKAGSGGSWAIDDVFIDPYRR